MVRLFGAGFAGGGLAGVIKRNVTNNAVKTATTPPDAKPSGLSGLVGGTAGGIGGHIYASSVSKGGNFANNVIGSVATGSITQMGTMTGDKAVEALHSYMGHAALEPGAENIPTYQNVEIGGGRITGTEVTPEHPEGIAFGMYHADQYVAPEGQYTTVHAVDGTAWYKEHLYSYTSVRESREVTSEDPETGEETTSTEIWMVYTIRYNGESYLADHVFALTDEQKELASDYASNLSLFLGDGLLQNVDEWTGNSIPSLGDVTFTDGGTPVVYYNQLDERYASQPYGTDNIGGYGCGPTAMAIVVSSLTDDMVDPVEMAKWSYDNGYWCKSSGSYHALIPAAAEEWGLPVSGCTTSEPQRILDALADGKLVVAIMSEGHFTSSGHFIVLRGVKDGQIMVADPASYKRSGQLWDLSIILNEASRRAAAGGPFWIIG